MSELDDQFIPHKTTTRVRHVQSEGEHKMAKTISGHDTHKWEQNNYGSGGGRHSQIEAPCATMNNCPRQQKLNTKLHTYAREKLDVLENIDSQCQHYKLPVIVVASKGP